MLCINGSISSVRGASVAQHSFTPLWPRLTFSDLVYKAAYGPYASLTYGWAYIYLFLAADHLWRRIIAHGYSIFDFWTSFALFQEGWMALPGSVLCLYFQVGGRLVYGCLSPKWKLSCCDLARGYARSLASGGVVYYGYTSCPSSKVIRIQTSWHSEVFLRVLPSTLQIVLWGCDGKCWLSLFHKVDKRDLLDGK